MNVSRKIVRFSLDKPYFVTGTMLAVAGVIAVLAVLPSVWPERFPMLQGVKVDTDPENMLNKNEPVRVFHNDMKAVLDLHDMVVLGIANEEHENGVFTPAVLSNIYELTQYALTLRGERIGQDDPRAGVIEADVIAPSLVDNIEQGGPGEVKFEWLMPKPPETEEEALEVRRKAEDIPFLDGTLVSEDGKALCLYLPLTSKDLSYAVYSKLNEKIAELEKEDSGERYYITGLPVAEDVFGVQMFIQMGISAPVAMLVIFLLMLYFFRKLVLIISPMILAMVTVICTMGLLVVTGNTIHIMSSMIPIFIMPIAVLDSIHILSEFFDRYQETKDRRKTMTHVVETLFTPMLYTSLTSTAGFASLALTPIPPVQVFGIFVGIGIMLAWFLTITFIPAFVMLLPEGRLENFGARHDQEDDPHARTLTGRVLVWLGGFTYQRAKLVLALAAALTVLAAYGISLIRVNDNPTKWFWESHPIRVADRVLNEHFGGTYMAYLALSPKGEAPDTAARDQREAKKTEETAQENETAGTGGPSLPAGLGGGGESGGPALPEGLGGGSSDTSGGGPALPAGLGGEEPSAPAPEQSQQLEIFKRPEVLRYMEDLQKHLNNTGVVGKSNSLPDIVKTVHRELIDGEPESFRIPDSAAGVAQCLMQYQSSHRPRDLWHMVTPDYRHTSIWVQLKSGDNRDMERVVAAIDDYVEDHPLTFEIDGEEVVLEHKWFGKTYLNVVWQDKMVSGMRSAFLGSFLVVLLMMIILFQSGLWGLLCMIPLTITIAFIYGVIGLIGKDYDMPVAVLSSLTLGLAVDFAIHFLARSRVLRQEQGSWKEAYPDAFGEPGRAISRNIIVIAVGFLPLLLAPLVPYNTVGVFLASILFISGAGTLLLLPALVRLLEPWLFPETRQCAFTCHCGTCFLTGLTAVALVWVNVVQFVNEGWTWWTVVSVAALPVIALTCCLASRRARRRREAAAAQAGNDSA